MANHSSTFHSAVCTSVDGIRTTNELKIEPVCHESFQYNLTGNEPFIRILLNSCHMYATLLQILMHRNSIKLAGM